MIQETIDKARALGFTVTDRLMYRLETDTGPDNEERVYFWNVTFPIDYPNQHTQSVYDDKGLLALIQQYNNRFEDAKKDAETSQANIEAMSKLKDMWNNRRL